ncbi:hypothetical protein [Streptacidiphilus albus]|jgi:hypothetical protein|uniref:hypothetical protein n=1 Tax=Streptacidiphilus albus TaxID=105425 RepID=UPI00054B0396|nr:hypothetical protein [Streptacidiphilus albus]
MSREHTDDTAAICAAPWADGECSSCRRAGKITPVQGGDAMCRMCLAYALILDRGCGEPLRTLALDAAEQSGRLLERE